MILLTKKSLEINKISDVDGGFVYLGKWYLPEWQQNGQIGFNTREKFGAAPSGIPVLQSEPILDTRDVSHWLCSEPADTCRWNCKNWNGPLEVRINRTYKGQRGRNGDLEDVYYDVLEIDSELSVEGENLGIERTLRTFEAASAAGLYPQGHIVWRR